ncbi:MAG: helix-turn-helix transcriptional regulator [Chloroflexota bacterium]
MRSNQPRGFGALLKRYRRQAGLTQEELAERAGFSTVYISMLERGQRTPLPAAIDVLARALALGTGDRALLHAARRARQTAGRSSALIGRERELEYIDHYLQGGERPVLILGGEPGIGKSTLLREIVLRAPACGYRVLEGGCTRRGGQEPFEPILGAMQSHIRTQDEGRLRADLHGCAWLTRMLPELLDGPIEPLPSWTLTSQQDRRLMDDAVIQFLANVAGPSGTLLVLDDLQWADSDALDLLLTLVRSAASIPLLVVGAYRDSEVHAAHPMSRFLADMTVPQYATHFMLEPLDDAQASLLLDRQLDGLQVTTTARQGVLRRAGGVPFFLASWAQALRFDGQGGETVPWDLSQTIRQRVAMLPEPARDVVATAAVLGRRTSHALVIAASKYPEDDVLDALEQACRTRLLVADDGGYRFAHDVIREVIEADLGPARRAQLHRRIAGEMERLPAESTVEALAYHYARSGDHEKTVYYLERAGDQAAARHANATAEGYYRELEDRLQNRDSQGNLARAREKLGMILQTQARYDEALAALQSAATSYQAVGERESERRALAAIGQVHASRGSAGEGVTLLQPLVQALTPDDLTPGVASLYVALARLFFINGRYADQLRASERAVEISSDLQDHRMLAKAQSVRGTALGMVGRVTESLDVLEQVVHLARWVGDLDSLRSALNNLAATYIECGEFERSRPYAEGALDAARQLGDPTQIAFGLATRGEIALYLGQWREARADFEQAMTVAHGVGTATLASLPLINLAKLCLAQGAWDDADRYLKESLALGEELQTRRQAHTLLAERDLLRGHPELVPPRLTPLLDRPGMCEWDVTTMLPILAWAYFELGDGETAVRFVDQAIDRARAEDHRLAFVEAVRVGALVHAGQSHWERAEAHADEGQQVAAAMPYPYALARHLQVCGRLHRSMGRHDRARDELERALDIFTRLGAAHDVREAESTLAHSV